MWRMAAEFQARDNVRITTTNAGNIRPRDDEFLDDGGSPDSPGSKRRHPLFWGFGAWDLVFPRQGRRERGKPYAL